MIKSDEILWGNSLTNENGIDYVIPSYGGEAGNGTLYTPIAVNTYNGTVNSDANTFFFIKANVPGASIYLDGEFINKETPNKINIQLSDILGKAKGYYEISVKKSGYNSVEKYVIYASINPEYGNDIYYNDATELSSKYNNTAPYIISVKKYTNDVDQNFQYDDSVKQPTLDFILTEKPIDTPEDDAVIFKKLTITLDNNYVKLVQDKTKSISLIEGLNTIDAEIGSTFSISSDDITRYKIKSITLSAVNRKQRVLEAKELESISTTIALDYDTNVVIVTEKLKVLTKDIPGLELVNSETSRIYNINSKIDAPIGVKKIGTVEKITAYVNNQKYEFDNLSKKSNLLGIGTNKNYTSSEILLIPAKAFSVIGNYRIILVPSNSEGDGDIIQLIYNVVDDVYVGVPDIRNIQYPSELRGPDYVGTNVDFTISYDSINTTFVRLYAGKAYMQLHSKGKQSLNIETLLGLYDTPPAQDGEYISLELKLIPYNTSGKSEVVGKAESVFIKFIKSKLLIPRTVAINRIAEAFKNQFKSIEVRDDSSKYLTHLLHLGDGNNKVITTWTGSQESLILKLYEPVPTDIQTNQLVWISKLQSNPIIETVTLLGTSEQFCPPLKGPNFSIEADNGIGYKVYDDLLASGSTTSTDLLFKYTQQNGIDTTKLNIQYVSGSDYLFENFVNFGSAEERINNFFYKVQLIENYESTYEKLTSGSDWTGSISVANEASKVLSSISEIKRAFDGFENLLYTSSSIYTTSTVESISYPYSGSSRITTNNAVALDWYNSVVNIAYEYDKYNKNCLINNLPEFIKENSENEDFATFLDMIGNHYDIIWSYINSIGSNKVLEHNQLNGIANDMVYQMLKSFGWDGRKAYDSQFLWEYAFGLNKDGTQKYGNDFGTEPVSLKSANEEVWRRILNNLPYLLKHKGTARAMKAIMACYGVPQSMLTIMEFGGPQNPTNGAVTKFTYDDRTAAISLVETSSIIVPWHITPSTSTYPNSIELAFKPSELKPTATLISGSEFTLNLIKTTGSFGTLQLNFGGDASLSTYFETSGTYYPYVSVIYAYGPDLVTGSLDFPISTEYYSHVLLNKTDIGSGNSQYDVYLNTSNGTRITTSVHLSITGSSSQWNTGSSILVGGSGFVGELDEFRLWKTPLQVSKFNNHTLHPNAINGNHISSSSDDLIFRLDFELPRNRKAADNGPLPKDASDIYINNVAISNEYGANHATASNFYSANTYPYQYVPYDRTVTANVPSVGFGYGNKIRFENQYTIGGTPLFDLETAERTNTVIDLSYKTRVTQKSFDRAPVDSNRLGLFLSPTKELNMDILKAFGDFNIDNYIGDYGDEYKDHYSELDKLRIYYFKRLNRDIYEYIRLVKYIDKSLFDVLQDVAPARANVSKGLLIEPHFLERNKTLWNKPETDYKDINALIDTTDSKNIEMDLPMEDAHLDATEIAIFDFDYDKIDGLITHDDLYLLKGTTPFYTGEFENSFSGSLIGTAPMWDASIQAPVTGSIIAELFGNFQAVGMEINNGFGFYGENSVSIVTTLDINGNINKNRKIINLLKKSYIENVKTQISGYPTVGALPGEQVVYDYLPVTKYKYEVNIIPFATGSYGVPVVPSIGGDIVSVLPLNNYFYTHYKYKNNLGEGMIRSFWKGSIQDSTTTPDGLDPVETFSTNANILRVAKTGRGSGEPILEVD